MFSRTNSRALVLTRVEFPMRLYCHYHWTGHIHNRCIVRSASLGGMTRLVAAFAFGEPAPMIETNIRSVYLYTFYPQVCAVSDKEILQKVEETLYTKDPRSWFYALMDLGVDLKKHTKGINQRSKHHVKQSKFQGSLRQVRAAVLRAIAEGQSLRRADISRKLSYDADKIDAAIAALTSDGLIESVKGGRFAIVG